MIIFMISFFIQLFYETTQFLVRGPPLYKIEIPLTYQRSFKLEELAITVFCLVNHISPKTSNLNLGYVFLLKQYTQLIIC